MNGDEPVAAGYSHFHEWRVCYRVDRLFVVDESTGESIEHGPSLYVRCIGCGAMGTVNNPSPAEWRRATKPYRWFATQRLRLVLRKASEGPEGTTWEIEE